MLEFDTPFRQRARPLKSPVSPQFDLAAWKNLIETGNPAGADLNLCATALWLAGQAMGLREKLAEQPVPALDAMLSTILALATLNQQHSVLTAKLRKTHAKVRAAGRSDALTTDQLINIPIRSGDGMFEVDAGSRTDATVDAVGSWLYGAADMPNAASAPPDLGYAAIAHLQRFSLLRGHYDLWQQALWLDWRLVHQDGHYLFLPGDRDLAELIDSWLHRHQSNFAEGAWFSIEAWPTLPIERRRALHLPRTVISVDQRPGQRKRFVVARPSGALQRVSAYHLACTGLEESYLGPFVDRPLPLQPGLTCALLLRAWYVLHDLVGVLGATRPQAAFTSVESVRRWALIVRRDECVNVLRQALSVTDEISARIVSFLSWAKDTYKGLWGAPLVPLPGRPDELALAEPVLLTSNIQRLVEIWLTKGGLDDRLASASRGRSFEAELRTELSDTVKRNAIIRDVACAPHAIKKSAHFPEEIDLLVQFGSLLLVGEVKCLLFPADARERYNFLRTLRSACGQASRKATAIAARRDVAAQALGITEEDVRTLSVLPVVVLNQGFGMSLAVDDCVVTDAKFLKLYLGSGSYVSEAAINQVEGGWAHATRHLYRTATEAGDNFGATMRRPPPLYRFRDLLRWTSFGFPTASGDPLLIAQTELGALPDETQLRYDRLRAAVER
jgi:hypothetical protein